MYTRGYIVCFHGNEYITNSVAPEPRLGSDFEQKARLSSCDFSKSLYRKNWQNEPIDSTHQDKPICTLEYMVWPIRTGRNLPLKFN